jgi:hypothetical protein
MRAFMCNDYHIASLIIEVVISRHMTHVGMYSVGSNDAISSHAHFRLPRPWDMTNADKWDDIAAMFLAKNVVVHGFDVVDNMKAYVSIGEFPSSLEGHRATLRGLFTDEMATEWAMRQASYDATSKGILE